MALIITIEDLKTHLYSEIVDEITRSDTSIANEAIAVGIAEAKGYMSRYDLPALFGTSSVNATVTDANLKSKVKDLVRWHLIVLGVPCIDYDDVEKRYKFALEYFQSIQAGKLQPEGWPYHDTSNDPKPPQGDQISYSSNPKRRNHY
jgi:phage gp36-like protein